MTTMERERVELVHQAMVVLAWTHRNWPKGMVRYEAEGLVSSARFDIVRQRLTEIQNRARNL